LTSRQWLRTRDATTFAVNGLPLGVAGEITVSALTQSWANTSATCVEVWFGDPHFSFGENGLVTRRLPLSS
jgi:hypothetical protein